MARSSPNPSRAPLHAVRLDPPVHLALVVAAQSRRLPSRVIVEALVTRWLTVEQRAWPLAAPTPPEVA